MRPKLIDIDPADANLTGFASNVTGAAFTLTANDSGDNLAHQVSIRNDAVTDHSGKTVTLVGTDSDGNAISEAVTGPAGSATVESTQYFLTLTSATPSATIGADTFDIGWLDEVATKTYPLDWYGETAPLISFDVTGTIDYTLQLSNTNPFNVGKTDNIPTGNQFTQQSEMLWIADDNIAGATTDIHGAISDWPVKALRIVINSYTNGAEIQSEITHARSY